MVTINPIELDGNWTQGYALDIHTIDSTFIGYDEYGHEVFDTRRSEIGELLYSLKYKSDKTALDEIIDNVDQNKEQSMNKVFIGGSIRLSGLNDDAVIRVWRTNIIQTNKRD